MKRVVLNLSINQYVCFAVCFLLMAVIPIARYNKIFGIDLSHREEEAVEETPVITTEPDGVTSINTTSIGAKIIGYGGPTPVDIQLKDGKISKIKVLDNQESPEYLGAVINSDLLDSYYGLTPLEASEFNPDAMTGATYTSNAIKQNIRIGLDYYLTQGVSQDGDPREDSTGQTPIDAKFIVTLIIILAGAIVPLFWRNRTYRYFQLILNVVILGLWGGTFICYSLMVSYLANGITQVVMIPVLLMLVAAFIYPMFGKSDHYCNWLCPYGAIQELAGKCVRYKIPIPVSVVKYLGWLRQALWFALMWLLWTGLWMDWMHYEAFAAFFIAKASPVVLGIAGGFLILSFLINRPYCRFVCPTGSLFKYSEGRKQ